MDDDGQRVDVLSNPLAQQQFVDDNATALRRNKVIYCNH